jgi:ABC-type transporter Mla subunit MlaD
MPTAQKTTRSTSITAAARSEAKRTARRLDQINKTLEAAQKDLAAIGGTLGTGVSDLRRDVSKMLRDARRDLGKMRRAVQHDLDRLQKDLSSPRTRRASGNGRATTRAASKATKRTSMASR